MDYLSLKMDLFFIFIFRMLTLYAIFNNTFENFQQIINTRQTVLHIFYSLNEDKIRCSSDKGTMELNEQFHGKWDIKVLVASTKR